MMSAVINEDQLKALAAELAKDLKSEKDLGALTQFLLKLTVERVDASIAALFGTAAVGGTRLPQPTREELATARPSWIPSYISAMGALPYPYRLLKTDSKSPMAGD